MGARSIHPPAGVLLADARLPHGRPLIPFVVTAALVTLLAMLFVNARRDQRELADLPDDVRAELYTTTLREVQSLCDQPMASSGILHDHCVAQARFLIVFPECDRRCENAARLVLPRARR